MGWWESIKRELSIKVQRIRAQHFTLWLITINFFLGLSRSFYQQPPLGRPRRASWHADTGTEPGIDEFFSVRVGALEQAVEECRHLTVPDSDGAIKGAWLLTE